MKTVVEHPKKNFVSVNEICAEKVHILDTFEESDAESEKLSERIRKLDGYGEVGQSSKQGEDGDNHRVMLMKDISTDANMDLMVQHHLQKQLNNQDDIYTPMETADTMIPPLISRDIMATEGIINSQESTITMVDCEEVNEIPEAEKDATKVGDVIAEKKKLIHPEKRRSERLKREIHLTAQDKLEDMSKKRCLDGNTNQPTIINEVSDDQLHCLAKDMGVIIADDNFTTINLIKDIEAARHCLYAKQLKFNVADDKTPHQENIDVNEK